MDLMVALRVLLRRWAVVLPGLVIVVMGCVAVGRGIPPTYQTGASLLVLPANPPSLEHGAALPPGARPNPYDELRPDGTAAVLAQVVSSRDVAQELAIAGATGGYTLEAEQKSPILTLTVTGRSEGEARTTSILVARRVQTELLDRQRATGADPQTFMHVEFLRTSPVDELLASRTRVMSGLGALGTFLAVSLAFVVEAFAESRRRARRAAGVGDLGVAAPREPIRPPDPRTVNVRAGRDRREPVAAGR